MYKKSMFGLILMVGLLVVGTSAFAHGYDNDRGTVYGSGYGHMGYGSGYGHMWTTDGNEVVKRQPASGRRSVQYQRPGYGNGSGWNRGWGGNGGCWR